MNDYSPLLRILDGIIFEETIGALSHFVKMQTIFSLDSSLAAFFYANIFDF